MSADQSSITTEGIEEVVLGFLTEKTGATPAPDQDLFASGLVSSMFAMELVVFLEQNFGVFIGGADLKLDHFRTVHSMSGLVQRLLEKPE